MLRPSFLLPTSALGVPAPVSPAGEPALNKPTPVSPAALLDTSASHPVCMAILVTPIAGCVLRNKVILNGMDSQLSELHMVQRGKLPVGQIKVKDKTNPRV